MGESGRTSLFSFFKCKSFTVIRTKDKIILLMNVVHIYHWDRCVKKSFLVTRDTTLLSLQKYIHKSFEEEITTPHFRLYTLPNSFTSVDERIPIVNDAQLADCIRIFAAPNPDILLFVFNCEMVQYKFTSPDKVPTRFPTQEESEYSSQSSKLSRNSTRSKERKEVDGNKCCCCEFVGNSRTIEATHIFTLEEGQELVKAKRWKKVQLNTYLAANFRIHDINSDYNMIGLCSTCHHYFDNHLLKLNPDSYRWEVSSDIRRVRTESGIIFDSVNGTTLVTKIRPLKDVLIHRYNRKFI